MRSTLYQSSLWIIALGLILAGVYLSRINFMQTEWLSRAGCLIVMLGITSSLGVVVQERIIRAKIKRELRNTLTVTVASLAEQGKSEEEINQEVAEINSAFGRQLEELTHKMKLSLGILEVSLLITGTFIWGFGDLFV